MPFSKDQVSTCFMGFSVWSLVCAVGDYSWEVISPTAQRGRVRVTCSPSSLEYTPFSWHPLLALKDSADTISSRNARQPLPGPGAPLSTTESVLPSITLQVPPPLACVLLQGKKQVESYQTMLANHKHL